MTNINLMGPPPLPMQVLPVDLEAGNPDVEEVAQATARFDDPEIAAAFERLKRKD